MRVIQVHVLFSHSTSPVAFATSETFSYRFSLSFSITGRISLLCGVFSFSTKVTIVCLSAGKSKSFKICPTAAAFGKSLMVFSLRSPEIRLCFRTALRVCSLLESDQDARFLNPYQEWHTKNL